MKSTRRCLVVGAALAGVVGAVRPATGFTPKPVADDPLLRMPGTQPADGVSLEDPGRCLNCHDDYDSAVDPGFHWQGSMMAQAARDPLFWATMVVAAQDSVWALGTPNATDLCLRCHTPPGWLGGRSDPTNGSALTGGDFDGVTCDSCHRMYDPFFEDSFAGVRESADWLSYWDETDASSTPSSSAAATTLAVDATEAAALTLYNGNAAYDASGQPVETGWTAAVSGQMFVASGSDKRASFADANAKHQMLYSRFHKSRHFCGTCHDVSNPALANIDFASTTPGDGTTVLPSEQASGSSYFHVERTFSEFMLSDYGTGAGAEGSGHFAPDGPDGFTTGRPDNVVATCQDCHMPDRVGAGCNKAGTPVRPTDSDEHPNSGQPLHDLTGGNAMVPRWLAAAVPGSPNYDPAVEAIFAQGPSALTLDLSQGEPLRPAALLDAADRAEQNLRNAASLENVAYDSSTGELSLRIRNHTGHKLISGYPEGRRMWLNIEARIDGEVVRHINPFDLTALTLKGLDPEVSSLSPPLGPSEEYRDDLVYEVAMSSGLTGEAHHTFHFVLATSRYKDNRIPPQGFRIADAPARMSEPVWHGQSAPDYFTPQEYAGGWDDITVSLPPHADRIRVTLFYQTTTREYVEFLRDEINGVGGVLTSPTPSGEPQAYIAQTDPFFAGLAAWGDSIAQLYAQSLGTPGTNPYNMDQVVLYPEGPPPACGARVAPGRSPSAPFAWASLGVLALVAGSRRRRPRRRSRV